MDSIIENLSVRELLEVLLDDKAKRRLSLRQKTNQELFALYEDHLKVKFTPGQVVQYTQLLEKLHQFLGEFPPSTDLVTQFLAQYANRSRATLVRYAGILRGFMSWYGEDLDIRPARPKSLPQYVDPADIERLSDAMGAKRTHKATAARDIMLVRFATLTGLRRGELASLTAGDILLKQRIVIVRKGKGNKDRTVPLEDSLVVMLEEYLKTIQPAEKVFGLTARSITELIRDWAQKANVQLTPHSFRHFFAEQLLEKGVPLTQVSILLGHENLETTSVYLGLRPGSLREAVNRLGTTGLNIEGGIGECSGLELREPTEGEAGQLPQGVQPYTETQHKQKMRDMAGSLQQEVGLPNVLDLFVGSGTTFVSGLSIDQEENHLAQGLRSHLESGGFAEVLKQIRDWKAFAEQYLVKCLDLFEMVKGKIPENEVIISRNEEKPKPGLILDDFCGTVCADVVGKVTGSPTQLGYNVVPHFLNHDLQVLKYGGHGIYIGLTAKDLEKHQEMYDKLITRCVSAPSTKSMAILREEMSGIETQISQQLRKFGDLERLPGKCELC